MHEVKKYSTEVKAQQSLKKECQDSVTFFLLCCHLFNFFRAAASWSTSKTARGLCAFAAAE